MSKRIWIIWSEKDSEVAEQNGPGKDDRIPEKKEIRPQKKKKTAQKGFLIKNGGATGKEICEFQAGWGALLDRFGYRGSAWRGVGPLGGKKRKDRSRDPEELGDNHL